MQKKKDNKLLEHWRKLYNFQENDLRLYNLRNIVLKHLKPGAILDVGCGTGHITLDMLKRGYSDITAVDIMPEMLEFTKSMVEKEGYAIKTFEVDIQQNLEFSDKRFDSIVAIDVLEHVYKDVESVKNLVGLLKPQGNILIAVPAIRRLYGVRDKEAGHYKRYSRKELIEKLSMCGLNVVFARYWNFIGLLPYFFYEKILLRRVNEGIRYRPDAGFSKLLNLLLKKWFQLVENRVHFPIGLTLFVVGEKVGD